MANNFTWWEPAAQNVDQIQFQHHAESPALQHTESTESQSNSSTSQSMSQFSFVDADNYDLLCPPDMNLGSADGNWFTDEETTMSSLNHSEMITLKPQVPVARQSHIKGSTVFTLNNAHPLSTSVGQAQSLDYSLNTVQAAQESSHDDLQPILSAKSDEILSSFRRKSQPNPVSNQVQTPNPSHLSQFQPPTVQRHSLPVQPQQDLSKIHSQEIQRLEYIIQRQQKQVEHYRMLAGYSLSPEQAVWALYRGEPVNLSVLRNYQDKFRLLSYAKMLNDPDLSLECIKFLELSLTTSHFSNLLHLFPSMIPNYIHYLESAHRFSTLKSFLERLPNKETLINLYLRKSFSISNPVKKLYSLRETRDLYKKFFPKGRFSSFSPYDLLEEQISLLEREFLIEHQDSKISETDPLFIKYKRRPLPDQTLSRLLHYCLFYHPYVKPNLPHSPENIKKTFHISEQRYFWYALKARSQIKDFSFIRMLPVKQSSGILNILTQTKVESNPRNKPVDFATLPTKPRNYKSPIGFEPFVEALHIYRGPLKLKNLMSTLIADNERRFEICVEYGLYGSAIEALALLRDRNQMIAFGNQITKQLTPPAAASYRKLIEQKLATVKWKR